MTEQIFDNLRTSTSTQEASHSRERLLALTREGEQAAPSRDPASQNLAVKEIVCDYPSAQKPEVNNSLAPECKDLPTLIPEQPFVDAAKKPIVVSEKDFDKLGDETARALRDNGVQRITVREGQGADQITVDSKRAIDVTPNPPSDKVRSIEIGTQLQSIVHKEKDGSIYMDNIDGLTATVNVLGAWQDVPITRVVLTPLPDGRTRITVTGQVGLFSQTQSAVKDGEIYKRADTLIDKLDDLKNGK